MGGPDRKETRNIPLSAVVAAGMAGRHHTGRKSICETPGKIFAEQPSAWGDQGTLGWKSDHWDGECKRKMMETSPKSLLAVLPQCQNQQDPSKIAMQKI